MQEGVGKVLKGGNPGQVADDDHGTWYRELFAPSVASRSIPAECGSDHADSSH